MPVMNTATRYGVVAQAFHWAVAILILLMLPAGFVMEGLLDRGASLEDVRWVYSLHKTVGLAVLALAVLRILWAMINPRPCPLHPSRKAETFVADTVHWMLYAAIILMPLTGFIGNSAIPEAVAGNFGEIWWPFGHNPLGIPESETLVNLFFSLHLFLALMVVVLLLGHVGGAMKHLVIDRDRTLQRMIPGAWRGEDPEDAPHPGAARAVGLGAVFAVMAAGGVAAMMETETRLDLGGGGGDWTVIAEDSTLGIEVTQMGAETAGSFTNWSADIAFDPAAPEAGAITVTIDMASLQLGSVGDQAKGADFLAVTDHPTATWQSTAIRATDGGFEADGELTMKGVTAPLGLTFTLEIAEGTVTVDGEERTGEVAHAVGETTILRLDHGVGGQDNSQVGFEVPVRFDLRALRN